MNKKLLKTVIKNHHFIRSDISNPTACVVSMTRMLRFIGKDSKSLVK